MTRNINIYIYSPCIQHDDSLRTEDLNVFCTFFPTLKNFVIEFLLISQLRQLCNTTKYYTLLQNVCKIILFGYIIMNVIIPLWYTFSVCKDVSFKKKFTTVDMIFSCSINVVLACQSNYKRRRFLRKHLIKDLCNVKLGIF